MSAHRHIGIFAAIESSYEAYEQHICADMFAVHRVDIAMTINDCRTCNVWILYIYIQSNTAN